MPFGVKRVEWWWLGSLWNTLRKKEYPQKWYRNSPKKGASEILNGNWAKNSNPWLKYGLRISYLAYCSYCLVQSAQKSMLHFFNDARKVLRIMTRSDKICRRTNKQTWGVVTLHSEWKQKSDPGDKLQDSSAGLFTTRSFWQRRPAAPETAPSQNRTIKIYKILWTKYSNSWALQDAKVRKYINPQIDWFGAGARQLQNGAHAPKYRSCWFQAGEGQGASKSFHCWWFGPQCQEQLVWSQTDAERRENSKKSGARTQWSVDRLKYYLDVDWNTI